MGELVGLALRGTSNCPMELNLRPVSVVKRHQLAERRPYILLAGVCTLLALAGWWLYFDHAAAVTNQVSDQISSPVNTLKDFENKMNAARAEIKAQQDTAAPLLTAVDDRSYWLRIIQDINERLPKDLIWVTSFEPHNPAPAKEDAEAKPAPGGKGKGGAKGTILTLKGLYLFNDRPDQASVVNDFVNKLAESELYTVDKESPNYRRAVPNDTDWAFDYEIPLILKNPISLPASQK
jgi:outer membrane murein-binding lipoprotein Lpp